MESDNQVSDPTTSRSGMGLLKIFAWGILIIAILAAVGLMGNRAWMASKLQQSLADLDRTEPGWRLEKIEDAREELPEEKNSARQVIAAAQWLPQTWPAADFPDDHFRLVLPNERLSDQDYERLSKELASVRQALAVAIKLADMPHGRHRIHYERNPIATLLPDQQESRRILNLLVYEAMRLNQKGDTKNALIACRAILNAARSLGDEPIFVSQLIRMAGVHLACGAIERTLAQGEPPLEEMNALQKLLEDEDSFPGLLIATRGERAAMHKVFE